MKKLAALFLVITIIMVTLTSCSGTPKNIEEFLTDCYTIENYNQYKSYLDNLSKARELLGDDDFGTFDYRTGYYDRFISYFTSDGFSNLIKYAIPLKVERMAHDRGLTMSVKDIVVEKGVSKNPEINSYKFTITISAIDTDGVTYEFTQTGFIETKPALFNERIYWINVPDLNSIVEPS